MCLEYHIINPLEKPISITAIASVSPLGASLSDAWEQYTLRGPLCEIREYGGMEAWVAPIPEPLRAVIGENLDSEPMYHSLDNSVKYALFTARNALLLAGWERGDAFGINIGSSRGATGLFEKYHSEFLNNHRTSVLASPTTTLGNISSWVSHDLRARGPDISHSITCSTALHALLNGVAWLRSGMADKFMVGGSEAPLTPFTIAQMQALKIYAPLSRGERLSRQEVGTNIAYPCRALDLDKSLNSMILGEGASIACLEPGLSEKSLALIEGVGYATEALEHNVSLSANAMCFQRSMRMALGKLSPEAVDVVVLHAPGTIKGDMAEYRAIQKVFGTRLPALTTNKWKIGHTFGASGMLSVELGVLMLQHQQFVSVPYLRSISQPPSTIYRVLINAVGFGGNAVSILLCKG